VTVAACSQRAVVACRHAPGAEPRDGGCGSAPATGALVDRAQGGSLEAFEALLERYQGRLYNFLLRRTRSQDDAEEITQEAFVRAWQCIGRYDDRYEFSTWLFTIGLRAAINLRRRRRRERDGTGRVAAAIPRPIETPDGAAHRAARRDQVRLLWETADRVLSESQRTALWLRYAEDLSISQIARVVGRSPVVVRVTLFRARRALAAHCREGGSP
jgi:RNA polymerase sigma-70 factor (ECF subfamily)